MPMIDANTDSVRMLTACTSGDEATVRELLLQTPSLASPIPEQPHAPLHYAVREGHVGIGSCCCSSVPIPTWSFRELSEGFHSERWTSPPHADSAKSWH